MQFTEFSNIFFALIPHVDEIIEYEYTSKEIVEDL